VIPEDEAEAELPNEPGVLVEPDRKRN